MERLVQYLDDLEDLIFALALKAERSRIAVSFFLFMAISATLQVVSIVIALMHPPVALAMAALLAVGMLYNAAVGDPARAYAS